MTVIKNSFTRKLSRRKNISLKCIVYLLNLLEENIGKILFEINHSKIFYDPPPRAMKVKAKINKWDLIKLKSFLHNKGNYEQDEKTALRMGENICKRSN